MLKRPQKVQRDRNTGGVIGRGRRKADGGGRLRQAWQVKGVLNCIRSIVGNWKGHTPMYISQRSLCLLCGASYCRRADREVRVARRAMTRVWIRVDREGGRNRWAQDVLGRCVLGLVDELEVK